MATLIFPEHPSPVADAEALKKASQGWERNEKAIISVIGHRNWIQRKLIKQAYQEAYQDQYQNDLIKLSGHLKEAVYRWMLDPEDRDAVLLNDAIKESDYGAVVEFACVYNPEEFLGVKMAYQNRFKRSVEEDLARRTHGDVRKLLLALASPYKYGGGEIHRKLAESDAEELEIIMKKKHFNDEELIRILSTRSNAQIVATLNHYKDNNGAEITKHLKEGPKNKYLELLLTTIRCINNPQKHYVKVLRNAINRPGTGEDAITRVILTRAEKNLREIKELYFKRNSIALEKAISKETFGYYKSFLLALLGIED